MLSPVDEELLTCMAAEHLDVEPAELRLLPIRTGHFNRSHWEEGGLGRFVLSLAPPAVLRSGKPIAGELVR
jgi:hypothetical protein